MKNILATLITSIILTSSFAQDFYDEGSIQKIEITFAQSNWDALLDAQKSGAQNYIMASSVAINGTVFDSVGVKYKGNSTYKANQTKNPFHIELDTYKDHEYDGYTDIKLSNVAKDPSFLREVLSYKILRNYMDAPLSNYANVYVNGSLIGLYSNSESISKKFVKDRFGSKDNAFIKCNPPAGAGPGTNDYPNLVYISQDSTQYYAAYELKSDYGWQELIDLCFALKNDLSNIEQILDVDRALWMHAFNNVFVNLDSYSGGFTQNYYLYRDDYGRFLPVVWDLNESFGQFGMTGSGSLNNTTAKRQMSHLLHQSDTDFPLISQLLSIPTYKKMYLAHCKTMLQDNFTNNGPYYAQGQALQAVIDTAVQADGNKFYTYNNFTSNLTTDVSSGGGGGPGGGSTPGITNLMNGRYTHLMNQTDFSATEPTISAVTSSNVAPLIGDNIAITGNVLNGTDVYLKHRNNHGAPFQTVAMLDDGMHNDGAANDGVYGANISITAALFEYYIYAENATIGKFSPTNAAHTFYTITATTAPTGDLVINEFLASNDIVQADQDGEFDDWVELFNKGNTTIDLSIYSLSDDDSDLGLFTFPAGATIAPDSFVIVWADKDVSQAGYHADFKLSAGGETIYLSDSSMTVLDSIQYTSQVTDTSFGRFPNGTGGFQSMVPTFAAINVGPVTDTTDTNSSTFVTALESKKEFKIYPNPAKQSFVVSNIGGDSQSQALSVFDIRGKLVLETIITEETLIDCSEFKSGIYLVKSGSNVSRLVLE